MTDPQLGGYRLASIQYSSAGVIRLGPVSAPPIYGGSGRGCGLPHCLYSVDYRFSGPQEMGLFVFSPLVASRSHRSTARHAPLASALAVLWASVCAGEILVGSAGLSDSDRDCQA